MGNFNPDDPCTVGLQWMPYVDDTSWLDSDAKAIAMELVADTNDTIEQFWTMVCQIWGGGAAATCFSLEIFDTTTTPVFDPLLISTYYPGSDLWFSTATSFWQIGNSNVPFNTWRPGLWGPTNGWNLADLAHPMYEFIDSSTLTPHTWPANQTVIANNEAWFAFFGSGFDASVQFAGVAGTQANRWITRVRSRTLGAQYLFGGVVGSATIQPFMMIDYQHYYGPSQTITQAQGPVEIFADWHANPQTGLPWTAADIDKFEAGLANGNYGLGWFAGPTGDSQNVPMVLQGQLEIESAATDPRLAIGSVCPPVTNGWREIVLRDPNTGAPTTVTFTAGHTYTFLIKRTTGVGIVSLCRTDQPGVLLPGPPNWSSRTPTMDSTSYRWISLNDQQTACYGVSLVKPGGSISLDSQPYNTTSPLDGPDPYRDLGQYFDNAQVNSGRSLQQGILPGGTDNYGWVYIMCAQVAGSTDGDLTITLKRTSDNVVMGTPATVTSDDMALPKHSWQKIGVRVASTLAPLVAATQYYFDITSTASPNQGWLVQVANGMYNLAPPYGPPLGTYVANYGSLTDRATINGVGQDMMDVEVTIATLPAIPSGFTATDHGEACNIDWVDLTWTLYADATCGGPQALEIQRSLDQTTWEQIAYITDPTVVAVEDWESPTNTTAYYRMRAIRVDGAKSDWSNTTSATPTMTGPGLMFTSNSATASTVFYTDIIEARDYAFPENVTVWQPQGQDGSIVFREIEDRLTTFNRDLRIRAGQLPCLPACEDATGVGTDVFLPLKNLCRDGLPYVCVKDEAGQVWYAFVKTPSGTWEQHGRKEADGGWAVYILKIEVTQLTTVPSPFNAAN